MVCRCMNIQDAFDDNNSAMQRPRARLLQTEALTIIAFQKIRWRNFHDFL